MSIQQLVQIVDPSISFTGTWINPVQFTIYNGGVEQNGTFISPYIISTFDDSFTEPNITSLNLGSIQQLTVTNGLTLPNLEYFTANSLVSFMNSSILILPNIINYLIPNVKYIPDPSGMNISSSTLTTLDVSSVEFMTSLYLSAPNLTSLSLPLLKTITTLQIFVGITTLNLPSIKSIGYIIIDDPNMTTFSFGSSLLNVGGSVNMDGLALNQSSVDGILVSLASLNGTLGTISYDNNIIDLSGGTSSSPSSLGIAAIATLSARGNIVTTN